MNNIICIPPALVLGCNTPHGINVLSDFIEEQTGYPPDFNDCWCSDYSDFYFYKFSCDNGCGCGYVYGYSNGNGYGDGYVYGYGNDAGDGIGSGSGYGYDAGDGRGNGHDHGYDHGYGSGEGDN